MAANVTEQMSQLPHSSVLCRATRRQTPKNSQTDSPGVGCAAKRSTRKGKFMLVIDDPAGEAGNLGEVLRRRSWRTWRRSGASWPRRAGTASIGASSWYGLDGERMAVDEWLDEEKLPAFMEQVKPDTQAVMGRRLAVCRSETRRSAKSPDGRNAVGWLA